MKRCRDASGYKGGRHQVCCHRRIEVERSRSDGEWRRDDGSDHGEGMLKAEEQGQENRNAVIQSVKWCLVVFVLSVEWPNIWGDKVNIILKAVSC